MVAAIDVGKVHVVAFLLDRFVFAPRFLGFAVGWAASKGDVDIVRAMLPMVDDATHGLLCVTRRDWRDYCGAVPESAYRYRVMLPSGIGRAASPDTRTVDGKGWLKGIRVANGSMIHFYWPKP